MPGIAQHIVQRGNNRQPCFFCQDDYRRYLRDLNELAIRHDCRVHAYVLMTNHVHLLMTPHAAGTVPQLMQSLGRRYVGYVNRRYDRTGTLWEGRYKSHLVDSESYLLRCYRYIELNPVRARMVADPGDYPWSSHRCNAFGEVNMLVRAHPCYMELGNSRCDRTHAYRNLVLGAVDPEEIEAIRLHLQRGYAFGPRRFQQRIEAQLGRRAGPAKIGRPRKPPPDEARCEKTVL